MKYAFALIAAAGLAATANAQNTRLVFEASIDGGATYSSSVNADATHRTVLVRVRAVFDAGTSGATQMGLAGLAFQPTLSNWDAAADARNAMTNEATGAGASPSVAGNTGRMIPFASAGQGATSASGLLTSIVDGGNTLRFAGSKATTMTTNIAWGVNSAQLTQQLGGSNYNSTSDVVVFRYSVTLNDLVSKDLVTDAPLAGINHPSGTNPRGTWYTSANGTDTPNLIADIGAVSNATIHYAVPTPGAMALLGLSGLAVGRRRR